MMREPNFLFIGPAKSGSTWLFNVLRKHPDCYLPYSKELYFFDSNYEKGYKWYLSHFKGATANHIAVGEISHDYLYSQEAAERIARHLPAVRLLLALREPVDKCFSSYLFMARNGQTRDSFEKTLSWNPELLNRVEYDKHISVYLRLFNKSQIKIMIFEDLRENPEAYAKSIFDFLGLEFIEEIDYHQRVLEAASPRNWMLARVAKDGAEIVRQVGLPNVVAFVKRQPAIRNLLYRTFAAGERPRISPETREMLREHLGPSVLRLQGMLDVDLSVWGY